ncbi:uncharacterized protein LOC119607501 [Lucilia sericata]|uniref:uncharacterized protein LOC119607501 n=1 Tax=Lucilia sericata TaxID=13632 RepID=UPI0018A87044|nr:uncharacterized protein LOC119607501 [Lucilia sericata]
MSTEQSATADSTPTIPTWVEASLFEPALKDMIPSFKQIKEFKADKALGAGENYNTVVLHLDIAVELNDGTSKSVSLILKTAHDNEMFRMMMQFNNVFDIETTMYKEVVPELEQLYKEAGLDLTFGAKFYELSTNNPYILLEDLRVKGFKNENRVEGLDMDHTKAVLKKLAQWHAASAVRVAVKGPYSRVVSNGAFKEEMRDMMKAMFASMYPIFMEVSKKFEGDEEYFEAMCNMQTNIIEEMIKGMKVDANEFNVLNHGDCWSNNVMFQHDAFGKIKETYLIDFQMPKYGSPAQDLYYFLLSSAKYEIKIKQFDYFIKYYHEQLVEHLKMLNYSKKIPALRDIHIMLYKYGLWGYTTANTTMAGALLDPTELAGTDNLVSNTDAGIQFKIQLLSNPRYRQHMKLVLPWLYNRGAF